MFVQEFPRALHLHVLIITTPTQLPPPPTPPATRLWKRHTRSLTTNTVIFLRRAGTNESMVHLTFPDSHTKGTSRQHQLTRVAPPPTRTPGSRRSDRAHASKPARPGTMASIKHHTLSIHRKSVAQRRQANHEKHKTTKPKTRQTYREHLPTQTVEMNSIAYREGNATEGRDHPENLTRRRVVVPVDLGSNRYPPDPNHRGGGSSFPSPVPHLPGLRENFAFPHAHFYTASHGVSVHGAQEDCQGCG